jgi:hypothetical protein
VQILHLFAGSAQQYVQEISNPDRYRPNHCTQCQARQPLMGHGFYRRTLVDVGFDGTSVARTHCRPPSLVRQKRYCLAKPMVRLFEDVFRIQG